MQKAADNRCSGSVELKTTKGVSVMPWIEILLIGCFVVLVVFACFNVVSNEEDDAVYYEQRHQGEQFDKKDD